MKEEYVDCLRMEWINKILSLSDEYSLSGYLGDLLKVIDLSGNVELINMLMQYENDYFVLTQLYEKEQRSECIAKAKELLSDNSYQGIDNDALEVNSSIVSTAGNDVERIQKLYEECLKREEE